MMGWTTMNISVNIKFWDFQAGRDIGCSEKNFPTLWMDRMKFISVKLIADLGLYLISHQT
jgi:hypothetical protein